MNIGERNTIQGPNGKHVFNEYELLQDLIRSEYPSWDGSILVKAELVSIRTKEYRDYILAKKEVKNFTTKEIQWNEV